MGEWIDQGDDRHTLAINLPCPEREIHALLDDHNMFAGFEGAHGRTLTSETERIGDHMHIIFGPPERDDEREG